MEGEIPPRNLMKDIVKCKYSSCMHNSKEINREDAICVGKQYYHKDCYQTKEDIKKIIDLFIKHVNPNPVYSQLQSVIKNIIFKRKISSGYLLFGLQYYISHNLPLNYPQGLYYVIQNKDVKKEYDKIINSKNKKISVNIEDSTDFGFEYKPTKQVGFEDILRK